MNKKKIILVFIFVLTLLLVDNVFAYECSNGREYVACGSGTNAVTGIPTFFPRLISFAIALMRILIPVVLIITGTIEMFKSIISGNQDNIAKGKKKIIGKYIGALLAFFIISFTTNIVKLIARGDEKNTAKSCFNCFLNNKCINTSLACASTPDEKARYELSSRKQCEEIIEQSECPLDRCSWGYNNGSEMRCYTPAEKNEKKCEEYLLESECPKDRCNWAYDGSERRCLTKKSI